jgi:osmotically-inducible protein OsmY
VTSRELATKISKAIENRAIPGIGVAVIDHVAYLDGHVASEAQRRVVERAARGVGQIRAVRNRIVVD